MNLPLMPKATAVWLVENTTLTFEQISNFCGMHPLEVQGIADGDVAANVVGANPIKANQLTKEVLEASEADSTVALTLDSQMSQYITGHKKKKTRYTPIARRQDKPDAIAWLVKTHPDITDAQLSKLIGTTKTTIASIRDKSHWNMSVINPRDPVLLGVCTQTALQAILEKIETAKESAKLKAEKEQIKAEKEKAKKAADRKKARELKKKAEAKKVESPEKVEATEELA